MNTWHPDTCPGVRKCLIELDQDGEPSRIVSLCPLHEGQRLGVSDSDMVALVTRANRDKNYTIGAVALAIKAEPNQVAWVVDEAGKITVLVASDKLSESRKAAEEFTSRGYVSVEVSP